MALRRTLKPAGRIGRSEIEADEAPAGPRGRGSSTNHAGRFEPANVEAFDDGWGTLDMPSERLATTLTRELARTVITYNRSPDIHFDRSINPYRGCEHGCIYCFARPSHAYQGLSAGLDFESRLFWKPDAPDLLKRELARPGYVPRVIALGVNTDAYQPVERERGLTRRLLEVLSAHNHPVSLLTKSALIRRDIDLIAPMAAKGLARVGISVTTLEPALARRMEPRAAAPHRRIDTITALAEAGIPVTLMAAPIIPALNDHEIEALLQAGADAGAQFAGYVLLRLPLEVRDLFHGWLAEHYPDRAARIVNLLREMRGGRDYDARWFERGSGRGPYARLIAQRFQRAATRLGLERPRPPLRTDLFRPTEAPDGQMFLEL